MHTLKSLLVGYILASLIAAACTNKAKDEPLATAAEISIKGKFENYGNGKLLLQKANNESLLTIDSTIAGKDGQFEISIPDGDPDFYVLRLNDSIAQLLLLDSTNIQMYANAANFHNSVTIQGSPATNDYLAFNKKILPYLDAEKKIKLPLSRLMVRNDLDSIALVKTSLEKSQLASRTFTKYYIDSIFPSLAIFNMVGYLNAEADLPYLTDLAKRLNEQLPHSKYTKLFSDEITRSLSAKQGTGSEGLAIGSQAPEFTLPDPNGKQVSLSSFKGKILLLDFWASWCGPCRAENPNVVRVYSKYKNKNFAILSVSLDKEKAAWLNAIQKDQLTWNHVSDLQFWNSSVVPLYSIQGIPATFLLDAEGKILAKNLRGEALEQKLQQLIQ